jgi:hypothetical protein
LSREIQRHFAEIPVEFRFAFPGYAVKRKKSMSPKTRKKTPVQGRRIALDTLLSAATNPKKNNRGRKRRLPWETVTGRAANYEFQLNEVWHRLGTSLLAAKTVDDVTKAFKQFGQPYDGDFVPRLSSDILLLLKDEDFPHRTTPQIKFLARSLAGRPTLSFRRSRDVCEKEALREKRKSPHRILRREFFIECSCGYNGPALDNDCPGCGAQPQLFLDNWTGRAPEIREVKTKRKNIKTAQPELPPVVAAADNPNTVRCECGTTISAPTREIALEALAKHKRDEHSKIANQRTEKPPV